MASSARTNTIAAKSGNTVFVQEEARRQEARSNRAKAVEMLERLAGERRTARHCSTMAGVGAAASGVTVLMLLLSYGDLLKVAPWVALIPATLAMALQTAARLLHNPARLDVADAVVCEQIVGTLNWASERGVDATENSETLSRAHGRTLDAIDERSSQKGEQMRAAAEKELARVTAYDQDERPKQRTEMARRCERIVPINTATRLVVDGVAWPARIIDVSRSGIALEAQPGLEVDNGKRVHIGSRLAMCIRNFKTGLGFEFFEMIGEEEFNVDIQL